MVVLVGGLLWWWHVQVHQAESPAQLRDSRFWLPAGALDFGRGEKAVYDLAVGSAHLL
jgi:hypothetical protein